MLPFICFICYLFVLLKSSNPAENCNVIYFFNYLQLKLISSFQYKLMNNSFWCLPFVVIIKEFGLIFFQIFLVVDKIGPTLFVLRQDINQNIQVNLPFWMKTPIIFTTSVAFTSNLTSYMLLKIGKYIISDSEY